MRPLIPLLLAGLAFGKAAPAQTAATLLDTAAQYEHGEGVPRDLSVASLLYCRAARMGDPDAQYRLGWMIANGRGFTRDDGMAWQLFMLAAAQQHPQALALTATLPARPDAMLPPCMRPEPAPATVAAVAATVAAAEAPAAPSYPPSTLAVRRLVERLAPRFRVDPALALAIIAVESGFRPNAVSPRNAQGLMQLIPDTARRFGVVDAFDPESNVRGGMAYLRWLLVQFNNDVRLVAAAYNAGENAVRRHGGVPPFPETQAYVQRVASLYSTPVHAYQPPAPALPRGLPTAFPALPSSRLSATRSQN